MNVETIIGRLVWNANGHEIVRDVRDRVVVVVTGKLPVWGYNDNGSDSQEWPDWVDSVVWSGGVCSKDGDRHLDGVSMEGSSSNELLPMGSPIQLLLEGVQPPCRCGHPATTSVQVGWIADANGGAGGGQYEDICEVCRAADFTDDAVVGYWSHPAMG